MSTTNREQGLSLADFVDEVHCSRRVFTGRRSVPIEWCSWCKQMLKPADECPVSRALRTDKQP